MNLEAGPASILSPPPLPGAVKGTLNAAERLDVTMAGGVASAVAGFAGLVAANLDAPPAAAAITAVLASACVTAARAAVRLRQGRPR